VAVILFLAFINYLGVKVGGGIQVGVTVIKVGLLAAIIVIGLGSGLGSAQNLRSVTPAAGGATAFFAALVAALWAYDGWNNVSMVASEITRPQRNLPVALIAGTLAVMGIYLLANLAYFYVLPASAVAASDRVAAEMMRRIFGSGGAGAVSIAAMVSIFAALNGSILSGSRVPYAMARDRYFFARLGWVDSLHHTPGISILVLSGWAALLVFSGRYEQLFTYVIFASWILYGMTAGAVLVLRRKRPELERPYRTVGYPAVPVLFVLGAFLVVFSTLIESPRESIMGLVLILAGLPFYFHWKRQQSVVP
jgi:amino acid transporter